MRICTRSHSEKVLHTGSLIINVSVVSGMERIMVCFRVSGKISNPPFRKEWFLCKGIGNKSKVGESMCNHPFRMVMPCVC